MEKSMQTPAPPTHPSRAAPRCTECRHMRPVNDRCDHPAAPVTTSTGAPLMTVRLMRGEPPTYPSDALDRRGVDLCGPEGKHFERAGATSAAGAKHKGGGYGPGRYKAGRHSEFAQLAAIGLGDLGPGTCVLETFKAAIGPRAGDLVQRAYLGGERIHVRRACSGDANWSPWYQEAPKAGEVVPAVDTPSREGRNWWLLISLMLAGAWAVVVLTGCGGGVADEGDESAPPAAPISRCFDPRLCA